MRDLLPAGGVSPSRAAAMVGTCVAAVMFWVAYDGGTFGTTSRTTLAIALWWVLGLRVVFGTGPPLRLPWLALVIVAALALFAAWTFASVAWAPSPETVLDETDRVLLYLGTFLAATIFLVPRYAGRWCDGIGAGIVAVAGVALGARLFPSIFHTSAQYELLSSAATRLSAPVGYWNGLAILVAIGLPLLFRGAITKRTAWGRGAWLAPVPALAVVIYLTSSRGGAITAALAVLVMTLAVRKRVELLAAVAASVFGAVVAVAYVASQSTLVNTPAQATTSVRNVAALVVAAACIASGVIYAVGIRLLSKFTVPMRAQHAAAIAVLALTVLGVAVSSPVARFESFKRLPGNLTDSNFVQSHLLSSSGNGRWQLWTAAVQEFDAHPVAGGGAGSFGSYWLQHRPYGVFVVDAHSLYLQTLGELGVLGLLLVIAVASAGLAAGIRWLTRSASDAETIAAAALSAAFIAFLFGAAVDWMWELPCVTIAAFAVLGLLVRGAGGREVRIWADVGAWRLVAASAVVAVIAMQLPPLLSSIYLSQSQDAAARGDLGGAIDAAIRARDIAPWSASPSVQLALLAEEGGQFRSSREWIDQAITQDSREWTYWIIAARVDLRRGAVLQARRDLRMARQLNPLGVAALASG